MNAEKDRQETLYHALSRKKNIRNDGWLAELVSSHFGDTPFSDIHSYIVSIAPGGIRARHYHAHKEEWFGIASGSVEVRLKNVKSGEGARIVLDAASPEYMLIHVPPAVAHAIRNLDHGDSSIIVFSRTPEDPEDTYPFEM